MRAGTNCEPVTLTKSVEKKVFIEQKKLFFNYHPQVTFNAVTSIIAESLLQQLTAG